MNPSISNKLDSLALRLEEINALLSEPGVAADQERYRKLTREHAELTPVVQNYAKYRRALDELDAARAMQNDPDTDVRALAQDEASALASRIAALEKELQTLLLPKDPNDTRNIFLEIRAGTGGDEAALFAGDLFRMYSNYAVRRGWSVEVVNSSAGEHGGYKEIIARIIGTGAYSRLKFESGGHRVQRVPETEAQGRIHTSACTVAVMPEADELDEVELNPADLKIDTFRASGAGGQHVNKTDSAIRITHVPTGVVVQCQEERSQQQNRLRAMSLLRTKLLEAEEERRFKERTDERRRQIGSGDRSEKIRTYNFPQDRVTDHRINVSVHHIEKFMDGELDEMINALRAREQELAKEAKA